MDNVQSHEVVTERSMPNYVTDSFMELRLSNQNMLKRVELLLSGKRRKFIKKDQKWAEEEYTVGKPLVNEEGLNQILHIISMRTDPLIVQGNFSEPQYRDFIEHSRKELTDAVVLNVYKWDIEDNNISTIVDTLMAFIEPFMSRLIDNEERKSLQGQFVSREILNPGQQPQKKMLGLFAK